MAVVSTVTNAIGIGNPLSITVCAPWTLPPKTLTIPTLKAMAQSTKDPRISEKTR